MEITSTRIIQWHPEIVKIKLRKTVPLGSHTYELPRLLYYAFLSTCCQNLEEKNWSHRKKLGEIGGQNVKESDRERCQF